MNIPYEAVEAAHEQLEAMGVYLAKDEAEAALYAAATHLMARAWDEGWQSDEGLESNPYRRAGAGE